MRITRESREYRIYTKIKSKPTSGEKVASELGISRTAVWKFIEKLRGIGFEIESKKGYFIVNKPEINPYDVADIAFVELKNLVKEVHYYFFTDSTNIRAKEYGKPEVLHFAEEQSSGKGRLGRSWFSGKGGLYFTLTLKPALEIQDLPKIGLTAGVAVAKAVRGKIKWPNDVLIEGKKVCGILCEFSGEFENPIVIVGIGINVNNKLPEELSNKAGRLCDFYECKPLEVFRTVLRNFYEEYIKLLKGKWREIREEVVKLCETLGREVRVETPSGVYEGIAEDLSDDGALIVRGRKIYVGDCIHLR